jgi:hypothetical protein
LQTNGWLIIDLFSSSYSLVDCFLVYENNISDSTLSERFIQTSIINLFLTQNLSLVYNAGDVHVLIIYNILFILK